jgi:hypothetical protein
MGVLAAKKNKKFASVVAFAAFTIIHPECAVSKM